MQDRPTGQRFSLTYLTRGEPDTDSKTMRFRLAKLISQDKYQPHKRQYFGRNHHDIPQTDVFNELVENEIGVPFRTTVSGQARASWVLFLDKLPIKKVLDVVTILYKGMLAVNRQSDFVFQVNRIFQEENIAFTVDDEGGVHPIVDGSYAITKQAAISGMSDARYSLSLSRVNEIDTALMDSPANYIQAIRSIFGANENLFKLMFKVPRLDRKSAVSKIESQISRIYADSPTMQRSSAQILQSFGAWVDAAHHYRHEEGAEEPRQPDEELAIVLISEGLSFVRWLVGIDQKSQPD